MSTRAPLMDVGNLGNRISTVPAPGALKPNGGAHESAKPYGQVYHGPGTVLHASSSSQPFHPPNYTYMNAAATQMGYYPSANRSRIALHSPVAAEKPDPLHVSEYVQEIHDMLMATEAKYRKSHYMQYHGGEITEKMRTVLIDWLVEVHQKFKLLPETLYLGVDIVDRFLVLKSVKRGSLQLLGVVAMLLSSKYEEIYPPEVAKFMHVAAHTYNREEVLKWERIVLAALEYNLTVPTVLNFLKRFLHVINADREKVLTCMYLAELTLVDYKFVQYSPSVIAAACVYIMLKLAGQEPWPHQLESCSKYDERDFEGCVKEVIICAAAAPTARAQAVYKKYSSEKHECVAKKIHPDSLIFKEV